MFVVFSLRNGHKNKVFTWQNVRLIILTEILRMSECKLVGSYPLHLSHYQFEEILWTFSISLNKSLQNEGFCVFM